MSVYVNGEERGLMTDNTESKIVNKLRAVKMCCLDELMVLKESKSQFEVDALYKSYLRSEYFQCFRF